MHWPDTGSAAGAVAAVVTAHCNNSLSSPKPPKNNDTFSNTPRTSSRAVACGFCTAHIGLYLWWLANGNMRILNKPHRISSAQHKYIYIYIYSNIVSFAPFLWHGDKVRSKEQSVLLWRRHRTQKQQPKKLQIVHTLNIEHVVLHHHHRRHSPLSSSACTKQNRQQPTSQPAHAQHVFILSFKRF